MRFEEEFNIEIPDEDAEKIQSVRDAVDYIEKHSKCVACFQPWRNWHLNRRVVVTGIGLICGSGKTKEEVWSNLLAGRSAIGPITRSMFPPFPCASRAKSKTLTP